MVIKSLLDNDFYKFTMNQAWWVLGKHMEEAEYKFVDRNNTTYNLDQFNKIKDAIFALEDLRFREEELDYLKSIPVIKEDYVEKYLRGFSLPVKDTIEIDYNKGKISIRFKGQLCKVSMFEIPVMAIVSEIVCSYDKNANLIKGGVELNSKLSTMWPKNGFKLVDFGTRRRYSRLWQEHVVDYLKHSPFFVGTSNVELSRKIGKNPVGTMAHEWFQTHQGFYGIKDSQVKALENWDKVYPNGELGVALTDIFNMDVFSKDFGKNEIFSKVYTGLRHDSGDPLVWAEKAKRLFMERSNTLEGKSLVFSDGLNLEKALEIQSQLEDENGKLPINVIFGIGTKLTNNVGAKAPNIVIKNVMTSGHATAKISDEPGKSICEDAEYVKQVQNEMKNWK